MTEEEASPGRVTLAYLRQWRQKKFKSQGRLATDSGVSKDSISELERGIRKANFETVGRLAKGLGITPEELVHVNPATSRP